MLVNSGKLRLLDAIHGISTPGAFFFGCYLNNLAPVHATVLADLVRNSSVAPVLMTGAAAAAIIAGPLGNTTYDQVVIHNANLTNPVTIYGWYIVDLSLGALWACGKFSAPITIPAGGNQTFNPQSESDTI